MKTPLSPPTNDQSRPVTETDVREANARANQVSDGEGRCSDGVYKRTVGQAREEALALRHKLEAMESLLQTTKDKLAATQETIDAKDRRLLEVWQVDIGKREQGSRN